MQTFKRKQKHQRLLTSQSREKISLERAIKSSQFAEEIKKITLTELQLSHRIISAMKFFNQEKLVFSISSRETRNRQKIDYS